MTQELPEASLAQPLAYESVSSTADLRLVANLIALLLLGQAMQSLSAIINQLYFWFFGNGTPMSMAGLGFLLQILYVIPLATALFTAVAIYRKSSAAIILLVIHGAVRMTMILAMDIYQLYTMRLGSLPSTFKIYLSGQVLVSLIYLAVEMIVLFLILRRCRLRGVLS